MTAADLQFLRAHPCVRFVSDRTRNYLQPTASVALTFDRESIPPSAYVRSWHERDGANVHHQRRMTGVSRTQCDDIFVALQGEGIPYPTEAPVLLT
jgi:hypothetical protein